MSTVNWIYDYKFIMKKIILFLAVITAMVVVRWVTLESQLICGIVEMKTERGAVESLVVRSTSKLNVVNVSTDTFLSYSQGERYCYKNKHDDDYLFAILSVLCSGFLTGLIIGYGFRERD